MEGDYRTRSRLLRRTLIAGVVFGLVILPAVNVVEWWLGLSRHASGAELRYDLTLDLVLLIVILALVVVAERRALAASREPGGPYPRDRIAALNSSAGVGMFAALPGFMAAAVAGWAWTVALYGVYVLFLARILVLWRRCEREAYR